MSREEDRSHDRRRNNETNIYVSINLEGLRFIPEALALLREIAQATERIEMRQEDLQARLTEVGAQLDEVTTSFGTTIQTGVDRILAEIAKQGTVTPEIQAAADHLSNAASGLQALNVDALARFQSAGIPDVPPAPEPIPPVEPLPEPEPVPGGGEGGEVQPMSRRR